MENTALRFLSFIFVQCKKSKTEIKDEPQIAIKVTKLEKLKELTWQILSLAKNENFKKLVYDECRTQKYGDYYVRVLELLASPKAKVFISNEREVSILKTVSELKVFGVTNPIIFYPSIETKEDKEFKGKMTPVNFVVDEVIGVIDDGVGGGGGSYTNYQYPGYTFNTDGRLNYAQQITEEFAWENDVWVIGEEENCSEGNMVAAPEDFAINPLPERPQGVQEYGAIIQVIDIGALEPWISGKLEFKYTVFNTTGIKILGTLELGKVKRKYFKDLKWYDYNKFIGNWNTSAFGDRLFEHWLEDDGGDSNPITATLPSQTGSTGISYTVTIPAKNRDDDMGVTVIQFTDLISQVYNVSYANVKHKN